MNCTEDYEYSKEYLVSSLQEALISGKAVFSYIPKGYSCVFPLFLIEVALNDNYVLRVKIICYADSVWRDYYRNIILKGLRVSEVAIVDNKTNQTEVCLDKTLLGVSDFICELSGYLDDLKSHCDKLGKKDFRAWSIDCRELLKYKKDA